MKTLKSLIACTLLCAANSYAEPVPVPPAKVAYIGRWQGEDMSLHIAADGKIAYKRLSSANKQSYKTRKQIDLNIELAGFNGDNFDAGFGFFRSTFVVSKPPTTSDGATTMVVDGIELTRMDEGGAAGTGYRAQGN